MAHDMSHDNLKKQISILKKQTKYLTSSAVRLVRRYDGCHELIGGTEEERDRVRGWCKRFAPGIALNKPSNQKLVVVCFVFPVHPAMCSSFATSVPNANLTRFAHDCECPLPTAPFTSNFRYARSVRQVAGWPMIYSLTAGGDFFEARFWARTMILARSTSNADVMRNNVSKLGLCTFCSTNAIVCRANPAFRAIWPSEIFCFSRCSFKMSAT